MLYIRFSSEKTPVHNVTHLKLAILRTYGRRAPQQLVDHFCERPNDRANRLEGVGHKPEISTYTYVSKDLTESATSLAHPRKRVFRPFLPDRRGRSAI